MRKSDTTGPTPLDNFHSDDLRAELSRRDAIAKEAVQLYKNLTETTARTSAYDEAMGTVTAVHGPLSAREREIAQTAARASYRRSSREIIELLQERVKNV